MIVPMSCETVPIDGTIGAIRGLQGVEPEKIIVDDG